MTDDKNETALVVSPKTSALRNKSAEVSAIQEAMRA